MASLTALGFLGVFAVALILAIIRGPRYGLFAYLWVFYQHPPARWWGQDLPDLRWSLFAAMVMLLSLTIHFRVPARRS